MYEQHRHLIFGSLSNLTGRTMLPNQLLTQKMRTAKQWQEAHFYTIELVLMQYNHAQF